MASNLGVSFALSSGAAHHNAPHSRLCRRPLRGLPTDSGLQQCLWLHVSKILLSCRAESEVIWLAERYVHPSLGCLFMANALTDHPRPRAQRTLTLITKTLQTLANLNTFGSKEPWMEPMNVFLTSHRPGFKDFIDKICDISSERATSAIPPSYATPITILNRLPSTSKEGFPSLPYLIDQARECAKLVDVWLDARHEVDSGVEWSKELNQFDELCEACRDKARECLARAEQAERPSGVLEPKWEELVEQMERKARLKEANGSSSSPNTPAGEGSGSRTLNSSTSSFADSYFHRRHHPSRSSPAASGLAMARSPLSPSSPISADEITSEETGSETTGASTSLPSRTKRGKGPPTPDDEDEDFSDLDIANNSDILGSSIYSLSTPKSKRDSAATNKTITPSTKHFAPINSKWRHHLEKGQQSQYSLQRSAEKAELARQKAAKAAGRAPDEIPTGERSIYRPRTADKDGGPKSPTERKDGKGSWGGALFTRKKVRGED